MALVTETDCVSTRLPGARLTPLAGSGADRCRAGLDRCPEPSVRNRRSIYGGRGTSSAIALMRTTIEEGDRSSSTSPNCRPAPGTCRCPPHRTDQDSFPLRRSRIASNSGQPGVRQVARRTYRPLVPQETRSIRTKSRRVLRIDLQISCLYHRPGNTPEGYEGILSKEVTHRGNTHARRGIGHDTSRYERT